MQSAARVGTILAILSGLMNGSFTLPMRFLGKWEWENVWILFILCSCLLLPTALLAPHLATGWAALEQTPASAITWAVGAGFVWGFGAIMFGQSVSAIGISLANTLVLAISSALGSLLPMICLHPHKLGTVTGHRVLMGVGIEIIGIAFCGYAGRIREGTPRQSQLVGRVRPFGAGLLLAAGAGLLSALFNIGFALAQPLADEGRRLGLSALSSVNFIWWLMLSSGAVANIGFCLYLLRKNRSFPKFFEAPAGYYYLLPLLMGLLWGGSIFVYGAAAVKMGELGPEIGWPLSLATGLLLANVIGLALGEWKQAAKKAYGLMGVGLSILLVAIIVLSQANR